MAHSTLPSPVTLESLVQRKAALKKELDQQKAVISRLGKKMAAPFSQNTFKPGIMVRAFNAGMAMYDSLLIGAKVIRHIRRRF